MSNVPQLLNKKAEELEAFSNAGDLVKEALFKELVKQGMDEHVAKGVVDESGPSYMDLWSKLLTEPNGSYMSIPLDADELRKVASYIEFLEKSSEEISNAPKKAYLDKLAELGFNTADLDRLETPTLEKIASMQSGDVTSPKDFGTSAGFQKPAGDPLLDFILSN